MSNTTEVSKKGGNLTLRHVLVVLTGILVCFGPCTIVFNTWSIFIVPVCDSLNVSTGSFTLYVSIIFLSAAIAAPFAGNLMEKYDVRAVVTTACALCSLGVFLCSTYTEVWQWYISGVLEGVGVVVLLNLTPPTLINRWFQRHTGVLVGSCVAMMGVGAAIWNMLGGVLLRDFDWRMAYAVFGIISACISMPATIFLIRSYPQDIGLQPYGKIKESAAADAYMQMGVSAKAAFKMPAFYLIIAIIALNNGSCQMGNYLAKYVYHLADVGTIVMAAADVIIMASVITVCLQIAQAIAKFSLGQIADHSIKIALLLAYTCGFIGVLCCWQGPSISPNFAYVGAALYGILFGATNVLGPTITRHVFGPREYTTIYSRIAVVVNLVPVFFIPLYAGLADASWDSLFAVALGVVVVMIVLAVILVRQIGGANKKKALKAQADQSNK